MALLEEICQTRRPLERLMYFMSHDKVADRFGWSPSTSLDSGIRNLIVWYKGYLENRYD